MDNDITMFRNRAELLCLQGYSILMVIVLVLFSGAWIFFNASEITRSDVKSVLSFLTSENINQRTVEINACLQVLTLIS